MENPTDTTTEPTEPQVEEPVQEDAQPEEPKGEEPQTEEPKAEEPQPEEPKIEEPQTEEPKAEEPQTEEPKVEEPQPEEPKVEEPQTEEPKAEEPQPEEPQPEEPKAEEPQTDEPKVEEPQPEELKAEKSQPEEPKTEEPKPEEPKSEEPQPEEPKVQEPQKPPRSKIYSTNPSVPVDLLIGDTELTQAKPVTLGQLFRGTKENYPNNPALKYKEDGVYKEMTYTQYYSFCVRAAKSFLKLELEPFHGVGILGFNSPEWFASAFGAIFAGGLAVGIYTTNSPESCQYILDNCKANIVVVENDKQLQKILEVRDKLPHLKAIVQYKGELKEQYPEVYEWSKFLELGDGIDTQVVEDKISALNPGQCASIIYTSGTTGNPKGVMLSHDNITWTLRSFETTFGPLNFGQERAVSYLPLSHIAAQFADMYIVLYTGGTVYFAQPDALKGSLRNTLLEAHPTMFVAVPRIWEKFMTVIKSNAPTGGIKKALSSWSKEKSLQGHKNMMENAPVPWGWTIATMVLKKAREAMGLTQCRILASSAAPIRQEVVDFFMGLNMPLIDLIGMSEVTGPSITNIIQPGKFKSGSVGRPLAGIEVKLDESASPVEGQGEICYRSRAVMMGYYDNEEKTAETIDDEGWLHSGDLATVDKDGFYYVTGRIKEIIITSGGENIAPVPIEDRIKKELPFLSNVFLVGERRHYLTCLLTLQCIVNPDTQEPTDDLTPEAIKIIQALGSTATKVSEVIENQDRAIFTAIQEGIDRANEGAVSNAQKVQKYTVLDTDFSIPGGELGPTLKIKRFYVLKKYSATIDGLYSEAK